MGCVSALIRKLLIANRGEIAVRIARTAHSLGIPVVAVCTDDDRDALHVERADEAERITSYLDIEAAIDEAMRSGADAIHPGYGFLAENADFAEACDRAGIVFIGPRADVIRRMGMKDAARAIAISTGVPVVPERNGFPMLIKAAAGGGGRGMRIVRSAAELDDAVESARGEAERSFGNGALLFEQYIENARHVEVQIFGDHHGNVVHLWERDCSVQRRYQKVIEESPSPVEVPAAMYDAAVALGRTIGYTNAGTVEFLLAPSGEFYFIEVNTRIQVEHPVTEMVTGLDLIKMQIEIAEGRHIDTSAVRRSGHAMEARLYAEDPANEFAPSAGTLDVWRMPDVRVDTGARQGSEIGVHYDPLLAKLIVHAEDRDRAIRKLTYALRSMAVGGVETNRDYLIQVLESEDFRNRRAHTGWTLNYVKPDDTGARNAVEAFVVERNRERLGDLAYYRNNPSTATLTPCAASAPVRVEQHDDIYYAGSTAIRRRPRFPTTIEKPKHETANSPMSGLVLRILVEPGQRVKAGDPLLVLEAMKMEQTIKTTIDGRVGAILVKQGQVIAPGQMLIEIDSTEDRDEHASHSAGGD